MEVHVVGTIIVIALVWKVLRWAMQPDRSDAYRRDPPRA